MRLLALLAGLMAIFTSTLPAAALPEEGPGLSAVPPTRSAPICDPVDELDDHCELWASYYDNEDGYLGGGTDAAEDIALSPDGELIFVVGQTRHDPSNSDDALAVAFRADDQSKLWVARYEGPAGRRDLAEHVAVSPDGSTVFVAGVQDLSEDPENLEGDVLLVAYDAETGAERWSARYDGGRGIDLVTDMVLSPDGTRVYLSGGTFNGAVHATIDYDYLTLSFDAATGEQRWVTTFDSQGVNGAFDFARGVSVSPDGRTLYVVGESSEQPGPGLPSTDFVTIAYVARDEDEPDREGTQLWLARYNGRGDRGDLSKDNGSLVGISPDGERLYIGGQSACPLSEECWMSWAILAYDTSSGQELWRRRWMGFPQVRPTAYDLPTGLAVSPTGDRIFMTGWAVSLDGALAPYNYDMATVGFDALSGEELWAGRYTVPGFQFSVGEDLAVSPDGRRVYTTGASYVSGFLTGVSGIIINNGGIVVYQPGIPGSVGNVATVAYDAGSGAQVWAARLNSSESDVDLSNGHAVAVAPDGSRVYTTGNIYPRLRASGPLPTEGANDRDVHVLGYAA